MSRVPYFNETSCAAPNVRFLVAPSQLSELGFWSRRATLPFITQLLCYLHLTNSVTHGYRLVLKILILQ